MQTDGTRNTSTEVTVRYWQPDDQKAVAHLYTHGLLAGQIDPNDTGADIENIGEAYFSDDRDRFWVAQNDSREIVGMIGVARDIERDHIIEIRRLRVAKSDRTHDIAEQLLETAVHHCKHHGFLKIVFDTRFERSNAVDLFERFGFQHTRTKTVQGKDLLEFYMDLYRQDHSD